MSPLYCRNNEITINNQRFKNMELEKTIDVLNTMLQNPLFY